MSDVTAIDQTFASGRYSKRKRTQVTYHMDELDVSDTESDFESVPAKKRKAATPKQLPKSKIFPFMQLPAEIRNIIYTYALTDPSGINLVGAFKNRRRTVERVSADVVSEMRRHRYHLNNSFHSKSLEPVELVPSLLATSKQIHQEGRDFLYSNELVFPEPSALYSFMLNLSPATAKQLRHIRLKDWAHRRGIKAYNHACFAVLTQATNIKTLRLDKMSGYSSQSKGAASKFYRDAFPWLEAVGAAKGKCDAGVDMLRLEPDFFDAAYWHPAAHAGKTDAERTDEFMKELRKLLGAQQQRVMKPMAKKRKNVTGKTKNQQ